MRGVIFKASLWNLWDTKRWPVYLKHWRLVCVLRWSVTPGGLAYLAMAWAGYTHCPVNARWTRALCALKQSCFEGYHCYYRMFFGGSCIHFLWTRRLWWRFDWPQSGSSFLLWWWQMTHTHVHTHACARTHIFCRSSPCVLPSAHFKCK